MNDFTLPTMLVLNFPKLPKALYGYVFFEVKADFIRVIKQ